MRSARLWIFFLCALGLSSAGFAQPANSREASRHINNPFRRVSLDTNYIKTYKSKLLISVIGTRKFQHIDLLTEDRMNQITYKPNNPYCVGLGLSYKSLSVDLTLKVPYLTPEYQKKGETDIFRVRLGYNRPRLWFSTMLQFIKGFYADNITDFDPRWFNNHENYMLRPDIMNFSWYTAAYYSFNYDKLTYQSSLGWEQRQRKSAGTFLLGGSVFTNYLAADSSIIPGAFCEQFDKERAITEQLNLQYGLNFGYVHTFLIARNFYVSLCVFPGLHYQTAHYVSTIGGKRDISGDFGSITEARAVVGYNSDKYYAGVTWNEIAILSFPRNTVLTNGYAHLKIFFGRRLNFNWFNRKHYKVIE